MQLTIRVDTGEGPQDVTTNLWVLVAWERKYKSKASQMAQALGMETVGYDPHVPKSLAEDLGVRWLPLDDVAAQADFLSLHLPYSTETHHLFDGERIRRMKPGSRLINCARGGLVDEAALVEALDSGHLAGAALDVFESEPPTDRRLTLHPRVLATPHLGASTREAQERVGTEIAVKVRDFLSTGRIVDAVNSP